MEQPPAKRHNTGYNPPPPTAEWVQTLALDHTDPQPLPDQSLTCTYKDGTKKVLEARTRDWKPFGPPPYSGTIEYIRPSDGGPILATVLRGYDGARGQLLAAALAHRGLQVVRRVRLQIGRRAHLRRVARGRRGPRRPGHARRDRARGAAGLGQGLRRISPVSPAA